MLLPSHSVKREVPLLSEVYTSTDEQYVTDRTSEVWRGILVDTVLYCIRDATFCMPHEPAKSQMLEIFFLYVVQIFFLILSTWIFNRNKTFLLLLVDRTHVNYLYYCTTN